MSREIWYTEEEEIVQWRLNLADEDGDVMGILEVKEDEPQGAAVIYRTYLPKSTKWT